MQSDLIIIGLTGSFGSGCSTFAKILESEYRFKGFKISDEIRAEAIKKGISEPDRYTLQDIGNEFRKKDGTAYWVRRILSKEEAIKSERIVIDGIRNLGEVQELRTSRRFFLVAVDCSTENRWERLKDKVYKGDRLTFERDDRRDKNEGLAYGQQVLHCVEEADIIFINEEQFSTELRIKDEIKKRFNDNLLLITGRELRMPNIEETMMAVASNLSLQSHCIKRRVGAVLCSKEGFIVSAAYNEVPQPGKSCIEEYRMCYRDFFRNKLKEELIKFIYCPNCGTKLKGQPTMSNLICSICNAEFVKFPPSFKALDKCQALHAEEITILRTPEFQINESSLYTTTFPCLQCAKRIIHARLKKVIYIDPYPEEEAIKLLEGGGIKTVKFGGVKAQAFYKFFYPYREWLEKQVQERLEKQP